ncbi:MAG: hypothetical protein KDA57_17715 [Planctomycetales bacterium]|nr:hypothetical protein [Planctomycetales bacterium]
MSSTFAIFIRNTLYYALLFGGLGLVLAFGEIVVERYDVPLWVPLLAIGAMCAASDMLPD